MKKILFLPLLTLVLTSLYFSSFAQSFIWAKQFSSNYGQLPGDMVIDKNGNFLSTGIFTATVDFDPGPGTYNLTGAGGDIYICKLNSSGNLDWAKQIPVSSAGTVIYNPSIATDKSGNVYVAGEFFNTVNFDPGTGTFNMTSVGASDIFILKLDSSGTFVYAKQMSGISDDIVHKIATDPNGNIVMTCDLIGTTDFDPGPGTFNISATWDHDIVICKLNSDGNFIWAKKMGGNGYDFAYTSTVDEEGNIFTTGNFSGTADFDPGGGSFNITASTGQSIFIAKMDSSGNFGWAEQLGSGSGVDIELDGSKNIVLTGYSTGGGDYDPGPDTLRLPNAGNYDAFVGKFDRNGKLLWIRQFAGIFAERGNAVAFDQHGNIFIAGDFDGTVDFDPGSQNVPLSTNGRSDVFICELTALGNFVSVKQTGGELDDDAIKLIIDKSENLYMFGAFQKTVDFDPGPSIFNLSVPPPANQSDIVANTFITKYGQSNKISGSIFFDANHDGSKQADENFLRNILVKADRNNLAYFALSDSNGYYSIGVDTGLYSVTVPLPPYYNSILPASRTAIFGGSFGSIDTANDFALEPLPGIKDLRVNLTALFAVRRGFKTLFRLTYRNEGTVPLSGNVTVNFDSVFVYDSAAPGPVTYNNHVLTYDFDNLLPGTENNADIFLSTPLSVSLGAILKSIAAINPIQGDSTPVNNTDTLYTAVTGSYDPNDKSVSPSGPITNNSGSAGQYLDYTIRFQNTGTDTAFTVFVRDTLSNNVDISSFQMISASHPYIVKIEGPDIIEWRFNNILLPDSSHNEPLSHGFVRYRVKTKNNLAGGDQIKNRASIYFDFNDAAFTNETTTTVNIVTGTSFIDSPNATKVFPNPTNSMLYIKKVGYFGYKLYDITGKLFIQSERNYNEASIRVGNLAKGIYILQMNTTKEMTSNKIVIE